MKHLLPASLRICVALLGLFSVAASADPKLPEPAGEDTAGFVPIFDGKTLTNWDADPKYWHVENGTLVGVVTPETLLKANSFAIWRGGVPADFELKVEYRVSAAGNSGINYRSSQVPEPAFALKGYQCDIDGAFTWTGQNYEERGRTFLALRGQMTRITPDAKPAIIANVGEKEALAKFLRREDWNQVHLIVRGNVLTHLINGQVMSIVVDEDSAARTASGLIGVQVHVGPPMKIEYRNFLLKTLPTVANQPSAGTP
ncbi:MAG: hypothetical protein RL693_276 [Verrucomicrobiota bacterium]|jgi:hypothetical protein